MNPARAGTEILNTIVRDNIIGIGLGGSDVLIEHNRIANNNAGERFGLGDLHRPIVGGTVRGVSIEENAFIGNNNAGIDISNASYATGGVFDVDVIDNRFDGSGRGLVLFNTHGATVDENAITNSTLALSAAIRIFDGNSDLTITFNDLATGAGRGIRLRHHTAVACPELERRDQQEQHHAFANEGLLVDPGSHDGTVDAECNWWGSPSGPTNPSNPGGTGEEVVGDADFSPWLVAPAPKGPIHRHPLDARQGDGRRPDPGRPGFLVARRPAHGAGDRPERGRRRAHRRRSAYRRLLPGEGQPRVQRPRDGRADQVRLDQRIAISSPGSICPGGGGKHATFTGVANVTRSTGY